MIDLKSDTPEKDRLHTEIFDMAKSIDQKMDVDEESIDANDIEEEEEKEERGGGLRKRRRREEEEKEEEEEEMEVGKTSVTKLDLPPGRQEHQKLKEHTICSANHNGRKLPKIHKMAREFLRDQLVSIYYMVKCPLYYLLMNTAERLHRNSHLSVPLAITEAVRIYKPELTKVLVNRKPKENSDE